MIAMFRLTYALAEINFSNAEFLQVTSYDNMFYSANNKTIIVKNKKNAEWIQARLGEGKGNVIIANQ